MFPRIITTNQNGRKYRYLVLVEDYRQDGKVKQRKVYSFGAITNPDTKTAVDSLLYKLRRYSSGNLFKPEELSTQDAQLFGEPLIGKTLWDKLELTNVIKSFLSDRKVTFDVATYILVLALNHLIAPKSDFATSKWYKKIYL